MIATELHTIEVEILNPHQRLTGTLALRGLLGTLLNDPTADKLRLTRVATEPILAGVPAVHDAPEAVLMKARVAALAPLVREPVSEEVIEVRRRYVLAEGDQFTVKGYLEVGTASNDAMHADMILKNHFFKLVDAILVVNAAGDQPKASWGPRPVMYVNSVLLGALFLG